jgi:hypothetical protein
LSYRRAVEAAPLRGAATMTVCTNHLALCNLVEDVLPVAVPDAVCDPELLVPKVVELKNDGIALTAIDAGMLSQKSDEVLSPLFEKRFVALPSLGDVALFVCQVVLSVIVDPTRPAVVVPLPSRSSTPGKFLDRLPLSAAPAPPHASNLQRRQDVPPSAAPVDPSK